ncbi:hypothetical protein SAMN05216326_11665 [Nitrosomonas marina]|uniref:Heavy-metal resistance n=1 Tax=Nitrosomonas marina TaxID=917 RepID=A0A1I0CWY0_9PROT|nr:hypothetical protein [Nitrosomonas marina]SET23830.1 hypothetical protein SAMN05216326_11665 [Nitrosomonas marina]
MKTATAHTITIIFLFTLLLVALPVSAFAADSGQQNIANHSTLAQHYKEQADEYQARIEDEIEAVRNKPSTAFLGRNAKHFKEHVVFKLNQLEMAVEENLEKAAYHEKMAAEQTLQPVSLSSN